jgi:DNA-binding GntR family transcriptional regulator
MNQKQPRLKPIKFDQYKPLREIVYESLREAILQGKLKPGERLMEIQLAEELGVSRTPVREAIRKLELEGLLVMAYRKGVYVTDVKARDIIDILEIRAVLEGLAAALAAERITAEELEEIELILHQHKFINSSPKFLKGGNQWDDFSLPADYERNLAHMVEIDTKFHDLIYKASRNKRLEQIITLLKTQIQHFRTTSLAQPGRTRVATEEHKKILEAISERNVFLAQELAQKHIENAEEALLNSLRQEKGSSFGDI